LLLYSPLSLFSFCPHPQTTVLSTLSLHDALPIYFAGYRAAGVDRVSVGVQALKDADLKALGRQHTASEALSAFRLAARIFPRVRSEEHTSELQSLRHLVCRLLLEKKKNEMDR